MQTLYVPALFVWLVLFVTGQMQFKRVRQRTLDLALAEIGPARKRKPDLTVEGYYDLLLPTWEQMVKKNAWFIPHRTELCPMPATPAYLRSRLNFTPAWLGAFLRLRGIKLNCAPELEEQITAITAMVPKKPLPTRG